MLLQKKFKYIALIIMIKALYVILNVLLLPEEWVNFDFDRDIQLHYLCVELLVLVPLISVYIKYLNPGHSISFALTILFCMYIIPSNSCLVLSNYNIVYYLSVNAYNYFILLFSGKIISKLKTSEDLFDSNRLDSNRKLQSVLRFLTIFTCFGIIAYVYFFNGSISFDGIFSNDLYEQRAVVAEFYLENTDGVIAYIMLFWKSFYSSMLIIGFYLSLKNKRYFDIALCLFTYLVLFSFETQKFPIIQ